MKQNIEFYCRTGLVLGSFLFLVCFIVGCVSLKPGWLTQYSTMDIQASGTPVSSITCAELLKYGDFGVGVLDKSEGELLILNGSAFVAKPGGVVSLPVLTKGIRYATVGRYAWSRAIKVDKRMGIDGVAFVVDSTIPSSNSICMIKIRGVFLEMVTRSAASVMGEGPDSVRDVQYSSKQDISGTILGFRMPPGFKGVSVPGYHLHFISDDRSYAGHVLSYTLQKGTVEIGTAERISVIMPAGLDGSSSIDIEEIERATGTTVR